MSGCGTWLPDGRRRHACQRARAGIDGETAMAARARWHAWRRLPSGSHLPHPDLTVRRAGEGRWTFERPLDLWLDGAPAGAVRDLTVRVEPDAATILV